MSVRLHNLKPNAGSTKTKKRVGRGGKSGTYSGRGMKGQKSRTGGKGGLKIRAFKAQLQSLPKLRGFKSKFIRFTHVNLGVLEQKFNAGETVNLENLIAKGIIKNLEHKSKIKILSKGELTKSLTVIADAFSKTAKEAIEKAGGKAEEIK
ncbi:MAG: 50S ribosomal protein L15 [Patescibacteria group bacterium]